MEGTLIKPDLTKPAFILFSNMRKLIDECKCPTCKGDIVEKDFKDSLSRREYSISGMCQKCQDKTFNKTEE